MKRLWGFTALPLVLLVFCACGANAPGNDPAAAAGSLRNPHEYDLEPHGAILPLTLPEAPDGLTTSRELQLDLSEWDDTSGLIHVTDSYVLTNTTAQPIEVTLCYPVNATLGDWGSENYRFLWNGTEQNYRVLTADTLEQAREPVPDLSSITAYRYRLTDITYSSLFPMPKNAAVSVNFPRYPEGVILKHGYRQYWYEHSTNRIHLLVDTDDAGSFSLTTVGQKPEHYTITGYALTNKNYTTAPWKAKQLPRLTAGLTVEEFSLSQVAEDIANQIPQVSASPELKTLFLQSAAYSIYKMMVSMPHYNVINWWEPDQFRIVWLETCLTIPAGESADAMFSFARKGAHVTYGPAYREGQLHYSIRPSYESTLDFTGQTLRLTGSDHLNIQCTKAEAALTQGLQSGYGFSVSKKGGIAIEN